MWKRIAFWKNWKTSKYFFSVKLSISQRSVAEFVIFKTNNQIAFRQNHQISSISPKIPVKTQKQIEFFCVNYTCLINYNVPWKSVETCLTFKKCENSVKKRRVSSFKICHGLSGNAFLFIYKITKSFKNKHKSKKGQSKARPWIKLWRLQGTLG